MKYYITILSVLILLASCRTSRVSTKTTQEVKKDSTATTKKDSVATKKVEKNNTYKKQYSETTKITIQNKDGEKQTHSFKNEKNKNKNPNKKNTNPKTIYKDCTTEDCLEKISKELLNGGNVTITKTKKYTEEGSHTENQYDSTNKKEQSSSQKKEHTTIQNNQTTKTSYSFWYKLIFFIMAIGIIIYVVNKVRRKIKP